MNKNNNYTKKSQDYDYIFKFVITGDSSVGKSSLLLKYSDNQFIENNWLPTIGVDFKQRSLKCDDKNVKISIWDTAGQERFKNIIRTYYKGCHCILLTFDITNRDSFQNVERWAEEVNQHGSTIYDKMFLLLVGNKADLEDQRRVCKEEGQEMAEKLGCKYIETSAKNGQNVDNAFQDLARELIQYNEQKQIQQLPNKKPITLGSFQNIIKPKKQNTCC